MISEQKSKSSQHYQWSTERIQSILSLLKYRTLVLSLAWKAKFVLAMKKMNFMMQNLMQQGESRFVSQQSHLHYIFVTCSLGCIALASYKLMQFFLFVSSQHCEIVFNIDDEHNLHHYHEICIVLCVLVMHNFICFYVSN